MAATKREIEGYAIADFLRAHLACHPNDPAPIGWVLAVLAEGRAMIACERADGVEAQAFEAPGLSAKQRRDLRLRIRAELRGAGIPVKGDEYASEPTVYAGGA